MKRKYKRILSAVLACVMIFALLPTSAFAADGDTTGTSAPDQVTGDINGYMAGLTADADTKDGYQNAFTVASGSEGAVSIDGTYRSSALNGKIWADKSVTANTANGTFGVTLSTLGQTFASTTTTTTGVAYDVVFVVDVSRSMTFGMSSSSNSAASPVSDSRMAKTVNALNDALDKLFANGNPAGNRIAVVTFNNTAQSLFRWEAMKKLQAQMCTLPMKLVQLKAIPWAIMEP